MRKQARNPVEGAEPDFRHQHLLRSLHYSQAEAETKTLVYWTELTCCVQRIHVRHEGAPTSTAVLIHHQLKACP
jgi:hypothetical protein